MAFGCSVDVISKYIDDSMPHRADYMLIGFGLVAGIFANCIITGNDGRIRNVVCAVFLVCRDGALRYGVK